MESLNTTNLTDISSDSLSFIYSHTFSSSSDMTAFWFLFVVTLLLLVLKTAKYIFKWKNKKLSTAETIIQLNKVLTEVMTLLETRPPHTPSLESAI